MVGVEGKILDLRTFRYLNFSVKLSRLLARFLADPSMLSFYRGTEGWDCTNVINMD